MWAERSRPHTLRRRVRRVFIEMRALAMVQRSLDHRRYATISRSWSLCGVRTKRRIIVLGRADTEAVSRPSHWFEDLRNSRFFRLAEMLCLILLVHVYKRWPPYPVCLM